MCSIVLELTQYEKLWHIGVFLSLPCIHLLLRLSNSTPLRQTNEQRLRAVQRLAPGQTKHFSQRISQPTCCARDQRLEDVTGSHGDHRTQSLPRAIPHPARAAKTRNVIFGHAYTPCQIFVDMHIDAVFLWQY